MPESAELSHELLRGLRERLRTGSRPGHRTDGLRIVLAVEGGGMRGTVTGGMALALHELGLLPAFDAVYGASAGAISAAWLLSSRPEGLCGWAEPSYAKTLIRWSAMLRGRPVVDVYSLIEVVYQTQWPMDFASVLANDVEYHPLATDAATGASIDLRPLIRDPAELRLALRASASLPFLAGPPVRLRDRRFYDAGVAESIPFRTPLAQGATHILVLRSRRVLPHEQAADAAGTCPDAATLDPGNGDSNPSSRVDRSAPDPDVPDPGDQPPPVLCMPGPGGQPPPGLSVPGPGTGQSAGPGAGSARHPRPPRSVRLLARTTLRKESPELRSALLTRGARTAGDVAYIAELEAAGRAFSIRPSADGPPVSRLTTDGTLLAAAFEAGRDAVRAVFR